VHHPASPNTPAITGSEPGRPEGDLMNSEDKDSDKDKKTIDETTRIPSNIGGMGKAASPDRALMISGQSGFRSGQLAGGESTLDPAWLRKQSLRELSVALDLISQEIKNRLVAGNTGEIPEAQLEIRFPELGQAALQEFRKLPATTKSPGEFEAVNWRIMLVSSRPGDKPITAEIRDDVTIGRATTDASVDLDLTDFGAGEKGVSRRHAMLHPSKENLLLRDLGSTNGTYCGTERATLGMSLSVKDGDVIRLGGLFMKVFIVHKPA
jgi:hypothetical protein